MMTAEEARLISENNGDTIERILGEIKDSAINGGRNIDVFDISSELRDKLKKLGYEISYYPNRITLFVRVSW